MWNTKDQDKGKYRKFEYFWLGPYLIVEYHGLESYILKNVDGENLELHVHGQYYKNKNQLTSHSIYSVNTIYSFPFYFFVYSY